MTKLANESEIIRRCKLGDIAAFEELYQFYNKAMYRVARGILSNHEDAEDAIQEAFVRLYKYIKKFRFKSEFSTWMYRVVVNSCYNIARKRPPTAQVELHEGIGVQKHSSIETRLVLEQALVHLPVKTRTCFVLFAIEGFKQYEIAEILNIKVGTVKAQIFAAKRKLRDLMTN